MLKEWFSGSGSEPAKPDAATTTSTSGATGQTADQRKEHARRLRDEEPEIQRSLTAEEMAEKRNAAIRRKLASSANKPHQSDRSPTYDGMFRTLNSLTMSDNQSDFHDGIAVSTSRSMHNAMIQSKISVGSPQAAGWELNLQSNGFTDLNAVTWASGGRLSFLHQRMFKAGAMAMGQFMSQNTPMGPQGNFFGMVQYPWMRGGSSQVSYLKGQNVTLSHAARIMRGTTVGAQLAYDMMQKTTSLSWGMHLNRGNTDWFASICPDKGEWKVATSRYDWELDTAIFVQLEMSAKKSQGGGEDLMSMVSVGMKKPFIGGATVQAVLQGFARMKATLDLPFGGDRDGLNAATVSYCVQYDSIKGTAKQGISLRL